MHDGLPVVVIPPRAGILTGLPKRLGLGGGVQCRRGDAGCRVLLRVLGGNRYGPSMDGWMYDCPSWSVAKMRCSVPPQLPPAPALEALIGTLPPKKRYQSINTLFAVRGEKRRKPPAKVGLHRKSQFLSTLGRTKKTIKKTNFLGRPVKFPFFNGIFLLFFFLSRFSVL